MPLTDEELLGQIATGGKEAYIALYDRFAPRVFGLLVRLLPNRTEAEDVLQEVMWEIWRKADRYDPALGSAQTWILLTARSRAIDAGRRLRRIGDLTHTAARERPPADAAPANPSLDADCLDGAIAELPGDQQTAIRLAYVHGLTRQEIAAATGVPIGTVKTRISLGIRKLSEMAKASGKGANR